MFIIIQCCSIIDTCLDPQGDPTGLSNDCHSTGVYDRVKADSRRVMPSPLHMDKRTQHMQSSSSVADQYEKSQCPARGAAAVHALQKQIRRKMTQTHHQCTIRPFELSAPCLILDRRLSTTMRILSVEAEDLSQIWHQASISHRFLVPPE